MFRSPVQPSGLIQGKIGEDFLPVRSHGALQ
jgi:hypothetical protein